MTASTVTTTAEISTTGPSATISTTGNVARILTTGDYSDIYTNGEFASVYTNGESASIYTSGTDAVIQTGGANAHIYTYNPLASVKSYNFAALDATVGSSLRDSAGTEYLTWGATAGNISISVDTTSTGHFYSAPSTATAGHFVTKNGAAPSIAAGRSAWFSNATGDPQFRNGTSSEVTLVYSGGALGTPASGNLANCTGLPTAATRSALGIQSKTGTSTGLSAVGVADIAGLTGFNLEANTWYKLDLNYLWTSTSSNFQINFVTTGTFENGATTPSCGVAQSSATIISTSAFFTSSTNISLRGSAGENRTNMGFFAYAYFKTGSAGTGKIQLQLLAGTTLSTITSAIAVLTKQQ